MKTKNKSKDKRIIDLYNQHKSCNQIAKIVGISATGVIYRLKINKIKLRNLSEAMKGRTPWNKEKKKVYSKSVLEKMSNSSKDKKHSKKTKDKIRNALKGDKNPNWKGGISPLYALIKRLREYSEWKSNIFKRDDFICQYCKKRGGDLEAHHIKKFSIIIREYEIKNIQDALNCSELWFVSNGITLCKNCHKKEHKK